MASDSIKGYFFSSPYSIKFVSSLKNSFEALMECDAVNYFSRMDLADSTERAKAKKRVRSYLIRQKGERFQVWCRIAVGNYNYLRKKLSLVMGFPEYRIWRKGKVVVLQGIDGSGKSTQSYLLKESEYLTLIGSRNMYAGNNQFWIPGLAKSMEYLERFKNCRLNKVLGLLAAVDRRLRMISALISMFKGKLIIFDRYFYDDVISYQSQKALKLKPKLEMPIRFLLHGWLGYIPDLTIYLDIEAENAYQRKQDYSIEDVRKGIEAYRTFLSGRREVVFIDAMLPVNLINHKIMDLITAL